jgi:FkbM family methyltransferase
MKRILNKINRIIIYLTEILEIGFKNRKLIELSDCYITITKFLKYHKPITMYDIGANSGEWSRVMCKLNRDIKTVVFFEPQKKYCKILEEENFLPNINKIIYNFALGDKNTTTEIKGGTASASILDAKDQNTFFPNSLSKSNETIAIKKLDDIFLVDKLQFPDTIKIDVQGYELFVLRGAEKIIKNIKYIIIELSFREFYSEQPKLSEIINFLEENNFILIDFGYTWRDINTNRIIQLDAFFMNKNYEK